MSDPVIIADINVNLVSFNEVLVDGGQAPWGHRLIVQTSKLIDLDEDKWLAFKKDVIELVSKYEL